MASLLELQTHRFDPVIAYKRGLPTRCWWMPSRVSSMANHPTSPGSMRRWAPLPTPC